MRVAIAVVLTLVAATSAAPPPGFRASPWFDEWVREEWVADGVRALAKVPATFDPKKPTRLVAVARSEPGA